MITISHWFIYPFGFRDVRFKGYCIIAGEIGQDGRWTSDQEVLTFEPKQYRQGKTWMVTGTWGGNPIHRYIPATQLRRFLKSID